MKEHANANESESAADGMIELCPQEIPLSAPESRFRFDSQEKQFVATSGALQKFGVGLIRECLMKVRSQATIHDGLDYLQVFLIGPEKNKLWLIEDGQAITALLPGDY